MHFKMSSAICLNFDQSKLLPSSNELFSIYCCKNYDPYFPTDIDVG